MKHATRRDAGLFEQLMAWLNGQAAQRHERCDTLTRPEQPPSGKPKSAAVNDRWRSRLTW